MLSELLSVVDSVLRAVVAVRHVGDAGDEEVGADAVEGRMSSRYHDRRRVC